MSGEEGGRRSFDESIRAIAREVVRAELAKLPVPKDGLTPTKGKDYHDGRDVDLADVQRRIEAEVQRLRPENGDDGDNGLNGWSPVLALVHDGERRVMRLVEWTGGQGEPPRSGLYLGPDGFTPSIAHATDLRGPAGVPEQSGGASDAGLKKLIRREASTLIEAALMEDFDQVPLDDQTAGSDDEVLTFTFDADVQKVWITLASSGASDFSVAKVRTDGIDPDSDTGQSIEAGIPQHITSVTSEVRVFTPAGKTVSVTGYRRRT